MTLRERVFKTGIRRAGNPGVGFRYLHTDGSAISDADAKRIAALRVPPAWADVAIARSARDKVQAIGRDAAGRWQYLYLRAHSARRSRVKFDRLISFGEALPSLRRALERDLGRPGIPLERASACAVALLSTCFLRPGSQIYAHENGSFGLTTLRKRHVTVQGDTIRFDYRGKHGRRQRHEVRSRRLAFILRAMRRHSGIGAFKYVDERGAVRDLSRAHINAYIKRAMGARFSARDFRTWAGTLLCAGALSRAAGTGHGRGNGAVAGARANGSAATTPGNGSGRAHANGADPPARNGASAHARSHDAAHANGAGAHARGHDPWRNRTSLKRAVAGAVRETSNWLGNTPAMSRRSYIHPAVLQAFERGEVVQHALHRPEVLIASGSTGLDRSEWELLLLLRRDRPARGARNGNGRAASDARSTVAPVADPARPAAIALPARRSAGGAA